ncbi:MAG TPA: ERAP1-like C-terminal domain-containing protein, partial [Nocardioides sp.]|nr:ERAP1-like C-terminal domain-containing protein [Nocardioides sp.]
TLAPSFELDGDGGYASFAVAQTAHEDWPTLRRHRLGIGLYDDVDGVLVRRDYLEIDVEGARTDVPQLVGVKQPALLLLNDQDHAYAKIRLDERSLTTAISSLSTFEDSLPRALVWGAAWDMTRDGEMRTRDWTELVLANIGQESDAWAVTRIPSSTALAVNFYSDRAHRADLRARWESGLRELLLAAEPGSDHQLTFARSYAGAAHHDDALDELIGLLDGSFEVEGLVIDQDMRWVLITALARAGRFGDAEIDAELEVDKTISGQEQAAAARASQPTPEAKQAAWDAMLDPATPNETSREIAFSIFRFGQEDVLEPYLDTFLAAAETMVDVLGFHKASTILEYCFPIALGSEATLARVDEWLADNKAPKQAQRYIGEARAEIARALRAREFDAS